ncbi:MAG: RibD family protein [Chloroflexota bacterium]
MEMLFPRFVQLEPEEIYGDLSFPPGPPGHPHLAVNMVTSADGKATLGGKAYSIGSKLDHQVMRRVRMAADGVLVGAETLRRENVNPSVPIDLQDRRVARGMAPQPTAIVVTATADLPLDRTFFRSTAFPRVVVTTRRAPQDRVALLEAHAKVIRAGDEAVDLVLMMQLLSDQLGLRRLIVEGGPTLNSALFSEGMVDELFWTVAPKIIGGAAMRTMVEGRPLPLDRIAQLQLVSLYHHESELFVRYRVAG